MATPLHDDCVGCRARSITIGPPAPLNGEEATVVLLAMLLAGIPFEQIFGDLCFAHRKQVDDTAQILILR